MDNYAQRNTTIKTMNTTPLILLSLAIGLVILFLILRVRKKRRMEKSRISFHVDGFNGKDLELIWEGVHRWGITPTPHRVEDLDDANLCIRMVERLSLGGEEKGWWAEYYKDQAKIFVKVGKWNQLTPDKKIGLICHEVGHHLGLSHSKSETSVMNPDIVVARPDDEDIKAFSG